MKRLIAPRDDMDKGRFDAFTDGVFAIAITLLVLEIHVPDLKTVDDTHLREALATLGGPLLTYALSFATVGIIWLNHHATFVHVKHLDRTANVFNLVLLALVCLVPYPTALLARYGPLPSAVAFYGATFAAMGLAYGANWFYAMALQSRIDPAVPRLTARQLFAGSIGTVLYALGTALAFGAPRFALGLFVCITVYYMTPGLFASHRHGPPGASGA